VPRRYDLAAITERYSVVVKNRFALMDLLEREPEDLWQEIKQTIKVAAEAHVPKITKKEKIPMDLDRGYPYFGQEKAFKVTSRKQY